jgi:magnesium chelatase subunit D
VLNPAPPGQKDRRASEAAQKAGETVEYPFAALVGQEQLKTALLLNAVSPDIGGLLIRGEKGTAKSTAARSLAALLPPLRVVQGCPFRCDPAAPWPDCPHCTGAAECRAAEVPVPFVDLPLGATEDRVLGALDFERVLREGRRALQPGLLAGAHRGILYIDEVNLLPDHLVDVLLDAAAAGVNTVQREGVSVAHPARFLLVGTMNPEEGDLRPQLLDRFGLMVGVAGPRDPAVRAEIVRRRLAFEADQASFAAGWAAEQAALTGQVAAARERLARVVLAEGFLTLISQLCCEFEVDGLRADLALHRTARARAAFLGRTEVTLEDVRAAAELTLPHRRKRRPFEQPHLDREQLDERLAAAQGQHGTDAEAYRWDSGSRPRPAPDREGGDGPGAQGPVANEDKGEETAERLFEAAPAQAIRRVEVAPDGGPRTPHGRRNLAPAGERGRMVRAVADEKATDLAVAATVRAAARRGEWADGRLQVTPADLHRKQRSGRAGTLLLFAVDASGSMAARRRMELVKGTVLGLLRSAYEQRDEVAVIAFRGARAEVLLPPTGSVELAERALGALPTGGRTPLAHALVVAGEVVRREQRARPGLPSLLIILSDGRANVPLPGTTEDPWRQALQAARELAGAGAPALVLDTDAGFIRLGRAQELARALAATCLPLEDLSAETFVLKLRQRND